jgi:hypothetical protein
MLTIEKLGNMPIFCIIIPKLTKHLVKKENISAILIELDKTVKKELSGLKTIIGFLSEIKI